MDDELMREIDEQFELWHYAGESSVDGAEGILLDLLQRARDRLGWIPVSERLPETTILVLASNANGSPVCTVLNSALLHCPEQLNYEITHWMPLPPPPSGKDG